MGRSYSVDASAVDAYREKVLDGNSLMTRRQIEHRIVNLAKQVAPDEHGFYPVNVRNSHQRLFYLIPATTNPHLIVDVLTSEEVKSLG